MRPLTAKERRELDRLSVLWATRKATARQIERCQELERKKAAAVESGPFHPCKCTDYNGKQCYNCLNGAHDICTAKPKCGKVRAKHPGVVLSFKP